MSAADEAKPEPCRRCDAPAGEPHKPLDDDCGLNHSLTRPHHPPRAAVGACCQGCADRHADWLGEVVHLYDTLATVIDPDDLPDQRSGEYQKPRKRPASPAPLNLSAWAMHHNQVNPFIVDRDGSLLEAAYLGVHLPDVAAVLAGWAQWVFDAEDLTTTAPHTVTGAAAVLTGRTTTLHSLDGIADYDKELRWLRRSLRHAHGISDPTPIGACMSVECGGMVWRDTSRCDRCNREYRGLDLVKLKISDERKATA